MSYLEELLNAILLLITLVICNWYVRKHQDYSPQEKTFWYLFGTVSVSFILLLAFSANNNTHHSRNFLIYIYGYIFTLPFYVIYTICKLIRAHGSVDTSIKKKTTKKLPGIVQTPGKTYTISLGSHKIVVNLSGKLYEFLTNLSNILGGFFMVISLTLSRYFPFSLLYTRSLRHHRNRDLGKIYDAIRSLVNKYRIKTYIYSVDRDWQFTIFHCLIYTKRKKPWQEKFEIDLSKQIGIDGIYVRQNLQMSDGLDILIPLEYK